MDDLLSGLLVWLKLGFFWVFLFSIENKWKYVQVQFKGDKLCRHQDSNPQHPQTNRVLLKNHIFCFHLLLLLRGVLLGSLKCHCSLRKTYQIVETNFSSYVGTGYALIMKQLLLLFSNRTGPRARASRRMDSGPRRRPNNRLRPPPSSLRHRQRHGPGPGPPRSRLKKNENIFSSFF